MISPTCPRCKGLIPAGDINVAADVAYCRACNLSHSLAALTHASKLMANVDVEHPPAGLWYQDLGSETVVGATHRSLGTALGILAAALLWNGIVSVFVLLAIAATLSNLGIAVPDWFPAPVMNGAPMGVGGTIFLWIFLTPFILIGLAMIGGVLFALFGRTEVRIDEAQGVILTSVGPFVRRRTFERSQVVKVRIENNNQNADTQAGIVIETDRGAQLKFATMLSPERKHFIAAVLQRILVR